jgi:chromosomal replication initiation ATPase DnaA
MICLRFDKPDNLVMGVEMIKAVESVGASVGLHQGSRRDSLRRDAVRASFVTDLVVLATGVPAAQIRSHTRSNARAARAQQMSVYLAHISFDWPLARVGAAFGRDRTTAAG